MPWEKQFNENDVLEKAMRAFWEKGYAATSMQDLVNCTGINRGSLYATYSDKHTLFVASLRMYEQEMLHQLLFKLRSNYGPRDSIRQFFMAFVEDVTNGGGNRGCFMTNTALELAPHDSEVRVIVASAQSQIEDFFAEMIKKGIAEGEIAPGSPAIETARGLLASLIGLVVLTRSRPERELLQSIVVEALRRLT